MKAWRDIYHGEEVGVDSTAAVDEAVLELSERGVHRVLRGPPGPIRHYVDGLPTRHVVVLSILHRHRTVLGPRRLGHRRRRGRGRGRGEHPTVQPRPAVRPQRSQAGPPTELRARSPREGRGDLIRAWWWGAVRLRLAWALDGAGESWRGVRGAEQWGEAATGGGRRLQRRRDRERLGAPNHCGARLRAALSPAVGLEKNAFHCSSQSKRFCIAFPSSGQRWRFEELYALWH